MHRLPGDSVLWNGDRRLGDTGSAPEVACAISEWLKGSSAKNVFLGCAAHVPGSWWTVDHLSAVVDLHALGLLDCVVTTTGVLARKIDDPRLFHLEFQALAHNGKPTGKAGKKCSSRRWATSCSSSAACCSTGSC